MKQCERTSGTERCPDEGVWVTDSGHFYCIEHVSNALREEPMPDTEPAPPLYSVAGKAVTQ